MFDTILLATTGNLGLAVGKAINPLFQGAPLLVVIFGLLVIAIFLLKAQTPFSAMLPIGLVLAYAFWQGFGQVAYPLYALALVATGLVFVYAILQVSSR